MLTVLVNVRGKTYGALVIDAPSDLEPPYAGAPYVCLLWDHGSRFDDDQCSAVARVLIESGCRYVVCGGECCEVWHDVIDEEFVNKHLDDPEEVLDAALVMTTWHTGESPEDVARFFVLSTNFEDYDFQHYLVLHVGTGKARARVDAAVRRHALS